MDFVPILLSFGSIALFFLIMVLLILRAIRIQKALEARLAEVSARENPILTLKSWGYRAQIATINGLASKAEPCMILVTPSDMILYDRSLKLNEIFRFKANEIRWFGRPQKYTDGQNEIWLHIERNRSRENSWQLLKIRLPRGAMQDFVRAIKTIVTPELVTAYRRARPYIHAGPVSAQPASQDIHGAWTLQESVDLYLMPRYLVILGGETVLRALPLEAVQQIGALQRLDQPNAQGLVRFRAEDEPFAFALPKHAEFAALLAEAAKRTLEVPLERKQKNKLDDEYDGTFEYDANFDA